MSCNLPDVFQRVLNTLSRNPVSVLLSLQLQLRHPLSNSSTEISVVTTACHVMSCHVVLVLFQELPTYNEKRRGTISAATLRNLQRSRSNPQLNLLFDTSLVTVNGSASLSSAHQYSSNGFLAKAPRVEPTRPALYTGKHCDLLASYTLQAYQYI